LWKPWRFPNGARHFRYLRCQALQVPKVPGTWISAAARELVQGDGAGHRDVERLDVAALRDRRERVALLEHVLRQPVALRAEHEDDVAVEVDLRQRAAAVRDKRNAASFRRVEAAHRDAECCAH
jgi:hypothetical protein